MLDFFVLALPTLMAAGGIAGMIWAVVRLRRLRAAWRSGIEVPGRCLRLYATTTTRRQGPHASSSTTLHHVYEFTAADGTHHRFEESGGPATVIEGDAVTVRYPQGRPDRATALPPGDVRTWVGTGVLLAFLAVFVTGCAGFGVFYLTVFKPTGEKARERVEEPWRPPSAAPVTPPPLPDGAPSGFPTGIPSGFPSDLPTGFPSGFPTDVPGGRPGAPAPGGVSR
ncbi:DUF3592 domain-containing protein [Streptomyces roseoverticillatus]|uniref:DUF3592 domain-containing protein n=1 Tax=Streptomyces roseoverticillatus TaxID=66429 RepID=A0ABV3J4R8_9ACTN